jgi:hypothetical protein
MQPHPPSIAGSSFLHLVFVLLLAYRFVLELTSRELGPYGPCEPYGSSSYEPSARALRLKSLRAVGSESDLSVAIVIIIVGDALFFEGAAPHFLLKYTDFTAIATILN